MPDGNYNLQIKRFSLDNDIRGFESFRFHSSPVTQFFGAHLSLVAVSYTHLRAHET